MQIWPQLLIKYCFTKFCLSPALRQDKFIFARGTREKYTSSISSSGSSNSRGHTQASLTYATAAAAAAAAAAAHRQQYQQQQAYQEHMQQQHQQQQYFQLQRGGYRQFQQPRVLAPGQVVQLQLQEPEAAPALLLPMPPVTSRGQAVQQPPPIPPSPAAPVVAPAPGKKAAAEKTAAAADAGGRASRLTNPQ